MLSICALYGLYECLHMAYVYGAFYAISMHYVPYSIFSLCTHVYPTFSPSIQYRRIFIPPSPIKMTITNKVVKWGHKRDGAKAPKIDTGKVAHMDPKRGVREMGTFGTLARKGVGNSRHFSDIDSDSAKVCARIATGLRHFMRQCKRQDSDSSCDIAEFFTLNRNRATFRLNATQSYA